MDVWPYLRLCQVSGRLHFAIPTQDPVSDLQSDPGKMSNGRLHSFMAVDGDRGGERGRKIFLQENLVHYLRKVHQPVGGKSKSGGDAITPITQPDSLPGPPTERANVASLAGSLSPARSGQTDVTRWCPFRSW